jgi:hypothetical protein
MGIVGHPQHFGKWVRKKVSNGLKLALLGIVRFGV